MTRWTRLGSLPNLVLAALFCVALYSKKGRPSPSRTPLLFGRG